MVSCVIPTYKRSDSLVRAVNSVLCQSYKDLEVIVVDDNHPFDDYSQKVKRELVKIHDERLRYVVQDEHKNGAAARNVGIKVSRGEYVAFLDDDDEWLKNKLKFQVAELEKNKKIDGVSCLYTVHKGGKQIRKCDLYTAEDLHRKVLDRSVSVCSTILFRKKSLEDIGCYDESMIRHQDLQVLVEFLGKYEIGVVPKYLVSLHVDIGGNRPNTEALVEIKRMFLEKMRKHIEIYDKKIQGDIYAAHYFEIVFLSLKERKYAMALKYLCKIGLNPNGYINLLRRTIERRK